LTDRDLDDLSISSKAAPEPELSISAGGWAFRAVLATALLFAEWILGWILFFSPGWANGWPFGIRSQTVLSVVVTGWVSVLMMTTAAGAGAIFGFTCALGGLGTKQGRRAYRIWLWIWAVATVCSSVPLFGRIHAFNMQVFPNGYLTP
jgi:hypothetical protein